MVKHKLRWLMASFVVLLASFCAQQSMAKGRLTIDIAVSHLTEGADVRWPKTDYCPVILTLLSMVAVMDNPS